MTAAVRFYSPSSTDFGGDLRRFLEVEIFNAPLDFFSKSDII